MIEQMPSMVNIREIVAASTIPHDSRLLAALLKDAAKELVALRERVLELTEDVEALRQESETRKQMNDVLNSVIDEFDKARGREND